MIKFRLWWLLPAIIDDWVLGRLIGECALYNYSCNIVGHVRVICAAFIYRLGGSWNCFVLYLHNQGHQDKMDSTVGFSAKNRSIHALPRRSNGSWKPVVTWLHKLGYRSRFHLYLHNQGCYDKTDATSGIAMSNRSSDLSERRSNCDLGLIAGRLKRADNRDNRRRYLRFLNNRRPHCNANGRSWFAAWNKLNYPLGRCSKGC